MPLCRSIYCTYYQLSEGGDSELIAVTTSTAFVRSFKSQITIYYYKADYYPSPIHVHNRVAG